MGKKQRNADGSKKKKVLSHEDEGSFERYSIWQLRNGVGSSPQGLDYCSSCRVDVPVNAKKLHEHYTSKSHSNKYTIETLLPLFTKHGMGLIDSKFYCMHHECELEAKAKTLIEHLKHHREPEIVVNTSCEVDFGSTSFVLSVFRHKLWKVDLQSTNVGLTLQLLDFDRIQCPFILRDDSPSGNFFGSLRSDIFTKGELSVMFKVASYLEIKGDRVDRSESIQGSKMNAFGMRWAMGDTGWYRHKCADVQKLALELTDFVSERLERSYPNVFKHLHNIVKLEGFHDGEAVLGGSPFTTFTVTSDYNCRPHLDQDDYDLGFIIWLQRGDFEDQEEVSLFSFPELRVHFVPEHGSVLCCRSNSLHHCTRVLTKRNQLGLAFFQKASLFRQLRKLLDAPADGVVETRVLEKGKKPRTVIEKHIDFERKKCVYKREVIGGNISLCDF